MKTQPVLETVMVNRDLIVALQTDFETLRHGIQSLKQIIHKKDRVDVAENFLKAMDNLADSASYLIQRRILD